ncbi:CoA transferase [SAR86 cluster bacterium]|nr:CoA transferase [SAR86 cluster bacterium]
MSTLKGTKIIEIAGIGPAPFAGMLLADMGAEVILVDRKQNYGKGSKFEVSGRGKKSIAVDLKSEKGIELVLKLIESADALIEGFRPGVMERLGLGPELCLQKNENLIYGRMTGWGQTGPLANAAGHDINYISLAGALGSTGRSGEPPAPPLNLIGDFGGGGMLLALGICAALVNVKNGGKGQVIDAAMTEGTAQLMSMIYGMKASGFWTDQQQSNLLDGATHFYDSYECKDGKFVSLGSIEPQFYSILLDKMELDSNEFSEQMNKERWNEYKAKFKKVFLSKTRDEWCEIMEGTDICFAPVLSMDEAINHPHNKERNSFSTIDEVTQPSPAPLFSETPSKIKHLQNPIGEDTKEILDSIGWTEQIDDLISSNVIGGD